MPASTEPPQTGAEWFAALLEQRRVDVVQPDGTIIPAEVAGAPVSVQGVTAYQLFFREVTERARLEQQLRQAEKLSALGQMISGVAHELNNPLAVIKGYLDLSSRVLISATRPGSIWKRWRTRATAPPSWSIISSPSPGNGPPSARRLISTVLFNK